MLSMNNKKHEILAIIPARGGSKGVPRKNIKPLAGKPLIGWTIETALKTSCINRVIVSTDDEEIAKIAKKHGADLPFMRPAEFASDTASDMPVYEHALQWLNEHEQYQPDIIVWLRPTSPLRTSEDIEIAIQKLIDTKADWIRSICAIEHHPYWVFRCEDNDRLSSFVEGIELKDYFQRQMLPEAYRLNGAVDVTWRTTITEKKLLYSGDVRGYKMVAERSVDLDGELDFALAEILMQKEKQ